MLLSSSNTLSKEVGFLLKFQLHISVSKLYFRVLEVSIVVQ